MPAAAARRVAAAAAPDAEGMQLDDFLRFASIFT
jgi:hypothetical protein